MIITEVKNINNISEYKADILIIPTKYSSVCDFECDLDLLKNIDNKIALKVDKIFDETEIIELEKFLLKSFDYNIEFYLFTDMAVYYLLKKYNMHNKGVSFSKTINCSSNDIKEYNKKGIRCLVSTELFLDDVIKISNLENNFIYCYGYTNIFYSKRKLLTLYKDYSGLEYKSIDKKYLLLEETRSEFYPVLENKNGTFISNAYIYLMFEELEKLNRNNYFYIDGTYLKEEDLISVVNIYNNGFLNGFSKDLLNELILINDNVNSGFLYTKPSILKEDN